MEITRSLISENRMSGLSDNFVPQRSYDYALYEKIAYTTFAIVSVSFLGSSGDFCGQLVDSRYSVWGSVKQVGWVKNVSTGLSISDDVRHLISNFGLNKKQAADILCIKRQTLYDWLADKSITPHPSSIKRLNALKKLMETVHQDHASLFGRFFTRKVVNQEATLETLLSAREIDMESIENTYALLAPHIEQAIKRQKAKTERTKGTKISRQDQLANYDSMTSTEI